MSVKQNFAVFLNSVALFKKVGVWLGRATAAGDFDTSGQQAVIFIEQRVAQNDHAERFSIKYFLGGWCVLCLYARAVLCKNAPRAVCVSAPGRDIKVRVSNRTPTSRDLSLKRFTSVLFTLKLNTFKKHEILFSKLAFCNISISSQKKLKCARVWEILGI